MMSSIAVTSILTVEQRYIPMRGFGTVTSASRRCTPFDGLRGHFRAGRTIGAAAGGAAAAVCRTAGGAGYPPGRVGQGTRGGAHVKARRSWTVVVPVLTEPAVGDRALAAHRPSIHANDRFAVSIRDVVA